MKVYEGKNATLTITQPDGGQLTIPLSDGPVVPAQNRPRVKTNAHDLAAALLWAVNGRLIIHGDTPVPYWQRETEAETRALSLTGDMYPWPTRWKLLGTAWGRTMARPVWCWL